MTELIPAGATAAPPSGLLRRLGAVLYDALLLIGVWFLATACVLPLNRGEAFLPGTPLFTVYLVLVTFLFFGWFWTHGGQTLGMRAWKIRVVNRSGGKLSWSQALVRFSCAVVSLGAAGFGYWWIAFSSQKQAWHDIASRSQVVRVEPERN